ncbi:MAG: ionic transporter y4hA [Nocardioidaceae bacterium]|nr:ionic transporter y4hA [Nocardioidaceae bacterium]
MNAASGRFGWSVFTPLTAFAVLLASWGSHPPPVISGFIGVALIGAVLAAVHHAEMVAHRIGEPFGSLLLAVAVTVIEVGLIVMLMVSSDGDTSALARDTVFAAVMITINGIVGISLVVGALRHHLAVFNPEGTGSALATVLVLAGLTMVVPTFTEGVPGPVFTGTQLAFAAVASLVLYSSFVFTQTVRHRDFFLPVDTVGLASAPVDIEDNGKEGGHAARPTDRETWRSLGLLIVSLLAVGGLAKVESYAIEDAVRWLDLPAATVGLVIALLVLAPESIAAVRAALVNRVQISLNLAYGSAVASIGLTIPTIAIASIWLGGPLALGLEPIQLVLLGLSAVVGVLTVVPGRAKPLNGLVHLTLLAAFVFLTVVP